MESIVVICFTQFLLLISLKQSDAQFFPRFRFRPFNDVNFTYTTNETTTTTGGAQNPENFDTPFIVGGKAAQDAEFPWQISLQKNVGNGNYRHFCGGSIIDETHVICASHCTIGQDHSRIRVVAGAYNMKNESEPGQQRILVKRMVENPIYNGRRVNNDAAVITLSEPLVFNDKVKPIRLAPKGHEPSGKCVSSGWGNANRLGLRPVVIPNALQKLNMTIVPRGVCRIPYFFVTRSWLTKSMICGGAGVLRGSCNGDSGGPLVCYDLPNDPEPYLAGITSFGVQPCGQMLFPTVFANVANMRDFIDHEMHIT